MKPDPSVELFYDGVWNEVGDWRLNSGIDMSRGRADEAKRADPSKGTLRLNNRHGNYSPRNPVSTLYGKIGRNTPLRVLEGSDIRLTGEVVAWPPRWDLSDSDVWVPIEAAGILRRLNQGQKPLRSALFRDLSTRGADVVGYWPLEEPEGAAQFASGIGHTGANFSGLDVAAYDELPASDHLPTVSTGALSADVPEYTGATVQRVFLYVHVPADGVDAQTELFTVHTTGTIARWRILLETTGGLTLKAYTPSGVEVLSSAMGFAMNGSQSMLSLLLEQIGASIDWEIVEFEIGGSAGGTGATLNAHTFGRVRQVSLETGGGDLNGTAIGHITVLNGNTDTLWSLLQSSAVAWVGETAAERIERLCADEGISLVVIGDPAVSELVGTQEVDELLKLLEAAAEADMGFLGEQRDGVGLLYRTRFSLYNQEPVLVLDYSNGEVFSPITPTDDDQQIRNQVTVKRSRGSETTATLEEGTLSIQAPPDGIGLYDTSVDVSLASDDQLPDQAGWRLHLGTIDEMRVPMLTLNLANPRMEAHLAAVSQITEGDRIQIENGPSWLPPGTLDLIVQGWDEDLGEYEREITFNCTPASAWTVGVLEDEVLGRADTAGSELASSATSSATSLSVATTEGPLWTTVGAQFPFDIGLGGEVMTVTAISGASSPQTFTVTRSVNGIVKAHAAGTAVSLAHPARLAL